jgi:hypothetical protein
MNPDRPNSVPQRRGKDGCGARMAMAAAKFAPEACQKLAVPDRGRLYQPPERSARLANTSAAILFNADSGDCFLERDSQHQRAFFIRDIDMASKIKPAFQNFTCDDGTGAFYRLRSSRIEIGHHQALVIFHVANAVLQIEKVTRHEFETRSERDCSCDRIRGSIQM